MRRSSKIALGVCAFTLIYLLMVYFQLANQSRKEFTQADGTQFLHDLGEAFQRSDASACVSFAFPDATVAGQKLKEIQSLLHNAFQNIKDPKVDYKDVKVETAEDQATVKANVTVTDAATNEVKYSGQAVVFKLERRSIPHLGGLLSVYEWKVANVDAQLPPEAAMP